MKYQHFTPSAAAEDFIECYWSLEADAAAAEAETQRIVPDGCAELILNLAQPFQELTVGGDSKLQPRCFFAGQITGPLLVRPSGATRTIGIRFRPEGASRILRLPMHELTGAVTPLDRVQPRLSVQLDVLPQAGSLQTLLAALDELLVRIAKPGLETGRLSVAVTLATRAGGMLDVAWLAEQVGLSSRQLERLFKEHVGLPPKLFCRILRFQRVFQSMEREDRSWVDAALSCGYYDQSHLIRDFKQFSGRTPPALLAADTDLATQFLNPPGPSRFSKTPPLASA
jgi:AraC-like DNA-binding protein